MKIKNSTIVITGGAGLVGSHLADELLKKNPKKIIILDDFTRGVKQNLTEAMKSGKIIIANGDIRNSSYVHKIIKQADYVFHEAAIRITRCAEDPRSCQEVLVDGTFNVLEACAKHKIKKLILASSASVYGDPSYLPIDEKHPFNNTTAYGAGKIATEEMTKAFHAMYSLPYIALRYFNIYGPRMDIYGVYTEVLIKWLDKIDANEPPILHGDGKQALDFVYISDIVRANIIALESDRVEGIYNVGTGKSTSLKELLTLLLELRKSNLEPMYQKSVNRPYVQKRQASTVKAAKELGFSTKIEIREGLKMLIDWRNKQLGRK